MSEYVFRVPRNPDLLRQGCQVTGRDESGVTLPGVEPAEGSVMFIGETAIVEMVAVYFAISPNEARQRLTDKVPSKQAVTAAEKRAEKVEADLKRWNDWRKAAEEHGLVINAFETT